MKPLRFRLRKLALVLGFGGTVLVLLAAGGLDLALGERVLLIAPHDAETVELNRLLYQPADPVAEIYGNPLSSQTRVIRLSANGLIRPPEEPELLLMPVDKSRGENPLQTKTVWFFARHAAVALTLLGFLGFALPRPAGRQRLPGPVFRQ